ncbi:UvrD-helicase domain-containing protein [Enterococcus sp. AZ046]|uniref:UvrD-helicase domain-containing protein n=1 Tax=Enterococcus sp. AZ046 TaxID=2774685 RepID=UPI003D29311C
MVERPIEKEVKQALACISKGENFILTGGAGSGKTYSLISLIEEIGRKYPEKSIVCITYTNNAVAEIKKRISNKKLYVSTIHEFIWGVISKYQAEMKKVITYLVNDTSATLFRYPDDFNDTTTFTIDFFDNSEITYDEFYNLKSDGNSSISHDHLLVVAERMFKDYTKLSDILKDIANFIFIDEYQDTNPLIIKILNEHLSRSSKKSIVGFFGDSMQSIYDDGVGSIEDDFLVRINKNLNRRNPQAVLNIANQFRDDGIQQEPSKDITAKNMENGHIINGSAKFIYAKDINTLSMIKSSKFFDSWEFDNPKETKELWLVHRANAKMSGFEKLYELYNSDRIIELISRVRSKKIDFPAEISFGDAVKKAAIFSGRGASKKPYIESDIFLPYLSVYESLRIKPWIEVKKYRINKDSLLSYKYNGLTDSYDGKTLRDKILKKLDNIYELIDHYQNKRINEFLIKTNKKINTYNDKKNLSLGMKQFDTIKDITIEEAIVKANKILNLSIDESFEKYINESGQYLWESIKVLPFEEFINSIKYQKEYLPYATQHRVKGSEFDNVLVVLDNMKWNNYNFNLLFSNVPSDSSIYNRTKKMFYVCITRAKRNLIVFMPTADVKIIKKAEQVFGKNNVHNGDDI